MNTQGKLPKPFEQIQIGSGIVGALFVTVAVAVAVGQDLGLAGVVGAGAGAATLYIVGAWRQAKLRDALYERAFAYRGMGESADPVKHFGVRNWSGRPGVDPPPYVERAITGEVEDGLDRKQLVLMTGPRMSGRSRTIYEIARGRPETFLVVEPVQPDAEDPFQIVMEDRRGLAAWEGDKIVFLRDFAARVVRRSLTADILRSWLERNPDLSIVATLSSEDRDWIHSNGEEAERSLREIEDLAESVELEEELKGAELKAARLAYSDLDEEQLIHLPRYLIADHPLRERLKQDPTKDKLGSKAVFAAAAFRRIGLTRPAPERFLRAVLAEGRSLTDDEFEQALSWALEPAWGNASLLYLASDPQSGEEGAYEVDPVVLDLLEEVEDEDLVPIWIWEAIYEEIAEDDVAGRQEQVAAELIALGEAALVNRRGKFGREILREARYLGNPAQKERCARALTSGTRIGSVIRRLVDSRRGDSIMQRIRAAQSRAEERQLAMLYRRDPDGPGRFIAEIYAHRIPRAVVRAAVLMGADVFAASLGLAVGLALRAVLADSGTTFHELWEVFLNLFPAWAVATVFLFALVRLYEQDAPRARFGAILQAAGTLGVVGMAAAAAAEFDLWVALLSSLGGTLAAAFVDYLLRHVYDSVSSAWVWKHSLAARTLLIGSAEQVAFIEKIAEGSITRPIQIWGYLSTGGDEPVAEEDGDKTAETPHLGALDDFSRVVVEEDIGRVLIVDWTMSREKRQAVADRCHLKSLPVEAIPNFADIQAGTTEFISGQSLTLIRMVPLWQSNAGFIGKRLFDVAGAVLGLVLLSPILIAIALAIAVFHRQFPVRVTGLRHGVGRDVFGMYRFKTTWDAPNNPDLRHKGIDDRPTPIGEWLRRHRLDELPQLLNVLRGDMSLVGPRPLRMSDDVKLRDKDLLRYVVRPGATGSWQISGREEITLPELTALEMAYLRNWSIAKDIEILVKTVRVVFRGGGRQRIVYDASQETQDDVVDFG